MSNTSTTPSDTPYEDPKIHSFQIGIFAQWLWNKSFSLFETTSFKVGWFLINSYSALQLFYRKSSLKNIFNYTYNLIYPANNLQIINDYTRNIFYLYVKNHRHHMISYQFCGDETVFDFDNIVPLKESPFISVEIMIERKINPVHNGKSNIEVHEIQFRNDSYDYYVEGNIFTHRFIDWFMEKYYKVSLGDCNYSLHIMRKHDFETMAYLRGNEIDLRKHLKE